MALTIQERLKDLRVERGLTLEQLAEQTHLSKSALGSYEADEYKDISHYALIKLAKFYGVTADYLLGLTETKNHPNADLADLRLSVVRGSHKGACDGHSRCANPQSLIGTQELSETDRFDTDLFSGYGGKRDNSKKPAYRDSDSFPVRPDKGTPGTQDRSKTGFTAFERSEDRGT